MYIMWRYCNEGLDAYVLCKTKAISDTKPRWLQYSLIKIEVHMPIYKMQTHMP